MKAEMILRTILYIMGTAVGGDAFLSLLRGNIVTGGAALAMVVLYFVISRKIDMLESRVAKEYNYLETQIKIFNTKLEDMHDHFKEVTKTVVRK